MVFNKYQHVTAAACSQLHAHRTPLRSYSFLRFFPRKFVATCATQKKFFSYLHLFSQKITIITIKIIIIDEISTKTNNDRSLAALTNSHMAETAYLI